MPVLAIANPITLPRGVQNQTWGAPWTAAPGTLAILRETNLILALPSWMPVLAIANPITFPRGIQNQPWGAPWTAAPGTLTILREKI